MNDATERSPQLPTIRIHSFGFKYGPPPGDEAGHGGGFVFDCRSLPNPFWDEALRPHSGREAPIVAFMERHDEHATFAQRAAEMVLDAARVYRERGYESLHVAFGCTGGRHRSVYHAEVLAQALRREGFAVDLQHRDMSRDGNQGGA